MWRNTLSYCILYFQGKLCIYPLCSSPRKHETFLRVSYASVLLTYAAIALYTGTSKIYNPTKVKHHLTCFNNIFSNNEFISNRFAVFVTCTHILTYLWNRLLIDFYLCVYARVCKVPLLLFNICVCERMLIFFSAEF